MMIPFNAISAAAAAAAASSSTSSSSSRKHGFTIVTYNVLAKSLGTNMIPWVMNVSPSIQQRILQHEQQQQQQQQQQKSSFSSYSSFDDWVNVNIKPEYMKHFHKNFHSGNYAMMREFWGCKQLQSSIDIPKELQIGLTFVQEDVVSYQIPKKSKTTNNDKNKDKTTTTNDSTTTTTTNTEMETVFAKTLRGIAKECLTTTKTTNADNNTNMKDTTLFDDFFKDVVGQEERIFSWKVRGPRIFQTIFNNNNNHENENDNHNNNSVDIIALQEYDFHNHPNTVANYRGTENNNNNDNNNDSIHETFEQAMRNRGYDGVFLKDPLIGRDPPYGLGLFWNRNVFEPYNNQNNNNNNNNGNGNANQNQQLQDFKGRMEILECNSDGFQGAVWNRDLQEYWHPISIPKSKNSNKNKQDASTSSSSSSTTNNNNNNNNNKNTIQKVLMKDADRRNVVLCKLRHKATNKIVTICSAHFMTTSRDGISTNVYPGEVRAGEIERIQKLVQEFTMSTTNTNDNDIHNNHHHHDALLFMGDFNTNANVAKTIFGGDPIIDDNNNIDNDNQSSSSSSSSSSLSIPHFDTGFDKETCTFHWGPHRLVDAFETQHQWGKRVGSNDNNNNNNNSNNDNNNNNNNDSNDNDNKDDDYYYCSSRNASRIEWIDYVFYDQTKLKCTKISQNITPNQQIPDENNHPSDHLPLFASFEFY